MLFKGRLPAAGMCSRCGASEVHLQRRLVCTGSQDGSSEPVPHRLQVHAADRRAADGLWQLMARHGGRDAVHSGFHGLVLADIMAVRDSAGLRRGVLQFNSLEMGMPCCMRSLAPAAAPSFNKMPQLLALNE